MICTIKFRGVKMPRGARSRLTKAKLSQINQSNFWFSHSAERTVKVPTSDQAKTGVEKRTVGRCVIYFSYLYDEGMYYCMVAVQVMEGSPICDFPFYVPHLTSSPFRVPYCIWSFDTTWPIKMSDAHPHKTLIPFYVTKHCTFLPQ